MYGKRILVLKQIYVGVFNVNIYFELALKSGLKRKDSVEYENIYVVIVVQNKM